MWSPEINESLSSAGVTEALGKLMRQKPEMYEEVAAGLMHYLQEYRRAKAACDDRPSIAAGFHRAMDQLIADAADGAQVSCTKGCAHCCHIEVHLTPDEAELLLRYTDYMGRTIDWARLEHQAKAERWRQLDYKSRRCVFLGPGQQLPGL